MTTYRVCCFLRRFRAASNEPSEELGDVFQAYSDGGSVMGDEALRRFLREVQGEAAVGDDELEATAREVMAFAAEQRLLRKGGAGAGLTVEGFHRWLCSDANAALDPRKRVYQDMGSPLSHYFIYTGHNSYLTGNQLSSGCSEVPIVKALHDGVRVIELDLWPNAGKDAVEVLHGSVEVDETMDQCELHDPADEDSILSDWWLNARLRFRPNYRAPFNNMFMLICWRIWKERNARIFEQRCKTPEALVEDIKEEAVTWREAGIFPDCCDFVLCSFLPMLKLVGRPLADPATMGRAHHRPASRRRCSGTRRLQLTGRCQPPPEKKLTTFCSRRTLTSPVGLMKCLEAIKEHAFVASPYPVILTLEDHLTPDLQSNVAKVHLDHLTIFFLFFFFFFNGGIDRWISLTQMIKETFGDMLYVSEYENMAEFPSPDDLKEKIIVSTKPPKEYLQTKNDNDADEAGVWGEEITDDKVATAMIEEKCAAAAVVDEEMQEAETDKKTQQGVDNEYRRLIAIPLTRRKHDMDQDLKVDPDRVTRLSLGEKAYEKAIVTHGADIIRFTQRNLLRIFPRSTRITSSNYNPLMGWRYGVQMVAANMQGHGRKLWLTQGMFRANGGCGYVKKPDILMNNDPDELFDPTSKLPVKTRLKVTVYMGDGWRFDFRKTHFDKYSPPDFYARVGIAGVEADTRMEQTKVKMDTWIPAWDHEFEFPLSVPELALLRVEVHESDNHQKDDFGGQTCLPVWELRRGIRSVRLCDRSGEPLRSVKLLMRFDFT
uniref:Phosphoinositide phospholipase C n=1 Tax=Oryza punctata TaxID=4537 RepID=A0A0E0KY26_ORYPU